MGMLKDYLINNIVLFTPEINRLSLYGEPDKIYDLTSPASRCLLLLIENSPEVVSQNIFFEQVWEKHGMLVPPNTLYQNISLVRRGFKSISGDDINIITTVPRKGFQIKNDVTITEIIPLDKKNTTPINSEDLTSQPAMDNNSTSFSFLSYFSKIKTLIIILSLFSMIFFIYTLSTWDSDDNLFRNYTLIYKSNDCLYYANDNLMNYNETIKNFPVKRSCEKYRWVYITAYKHNPVSTLFLCTHPIDKKNKNDCISIIHKEDS